MASDKNQARRIGRIAIAVVGFSLMVSSSEVAGETPLRLETYVTSQQVDQYCATPDDRDSVVEVLGEFGITKVYLESYRGGHTPNEETLLAARDHFRERGIEVATGITTTAAEGILVPSGANPMFVNYEEELTRRTLVDLFEFMASRFDEIMIDDFLLTDDRSEKSRAAKGDRTWSEYRLQLMTEIARDWMIQPAKRINPQVKVVIKYPQWYDRFHVYGYNAESGPKLFDSVWVGTETRGPDSKRFGFVQPTEGFINFSWLASLNNEKVRGAWFDTYDCSPEVYLMQAYQSVLAGAKNITLFNLGALMENDAALVRFMARRGALTSLAEAIGTSRIDGGYAYKPVHSAPGEDAYLFDFLAVLGVPIVTTGNLPDNAPRCLFLTGHCSADPAVFDRAVSWAESGSVIVVTPGFLQGMNLPDANKWVGFSHGFPEELESCETTSLWVGEKAVALKEEVQFSIVPDVTGTETLAEADCDGRRVPLLTKRNLDGGGRVVFWNISSFNQRDFDVVEEMFLPPHPLAILNWPGEFVNAFRDLIPLPRTLKVEGEPPFGIYFYGEDTIALANFESEDATVRLSARESETMSYNLDSRFPHAAGADVHEEAESPGFFQVRIPSWEVVVLKRIMR